ncbi:MAG: dihydrofolate reductase family protein [Bacteroidota bacterium]
MKNRKVLLFIAMSLDGYIARPDGAIDWLSSVQRDGEDYGYGEFIKTVDTVIIGRKTYDTVLSFGVPFPHADKECYIITRNERPSTGNLIFYSGDMKELVESLRRKQGANIFVDGGAEIVNTMMKERLFDEYIISIIPVFLGSGIRLFNDARPEESITLVSALHFESGLVRLHYAKINE